MKINNFQFLNIFGFATILFLPGYLTVLSLRLRGLEFWGYIGLAVGYSLLEIMGIGLIGNIFLPFVGVVFPLAKSVLLLEFSSLVMILSLFVWKRNKKIIITLKRYIFFDNQRDLIFAFFPVIFVVMSILGAIRLNNDGGGIITFVMLVGIALYIAVIMRNCKRVDPNLFPTALFFIALSLLFMTSLRGWFITGHDIQREYLVFELAKNNSYWSINNFHDAYNACMSITILPTIFFNLLSIFDPYIFKVFFQFAFAIVPGIIFLTIRRYVTVAIAFLSAVYFISFPTFFSDMPMLNRQEIAFLFFALMVYIIFNRDLPVSVKRIVFMMFGFGMVFSHYSTTYVVIAILIFLLFTRSILKWTSGLFKKNGVFIRPIRKLFDSVLSSCKIKDSITVWMVILLLLTSFFWSSILTKTSSGSVSRVVVEMFKAMLYSKNEETKSGEVLYSLFSWKKFNPEIELQSYSNVVVPQQRSVAVSEKNLFDAVKYEKYPIELAPVNDMPLTSIGNFFQSFGFNIVSFNYIFRQATAKLLQVFIIIGFIFLLVNKKIFKRTIDVDFLLLAGGSLALIVSQIFLPVLSKEYGISRAFQQALFFLGIFITVGSYGLLWKFRESIQIGFATTIAIIFFLSSTGVFTQMLGGYGPQLHLNNNGLPYDVYYQHMPEVAGTKWFTSKVGNSSLLQSEMLMERFALPDTKSIYDINVRNGIHPGLIQKDSYVYLGLANIKKKQTFIFFNGNSIVYKYPIEFLDENKNLVYNNKSVRIYK